jgi:hypothetical protein
MKKSIEQKVKEIESKKRLQKLAGLQSEGKEKSPEEQWEDLQKEMEIFLNLVRSYKKK